MREWGHVTSFEACALGVLHHHLVSASIGLLVWDADACVDRDLVLLTPYFADGCTLVIDDYVVSEAKSARVTVVVDDFVRRGIIEQVAYLPWGTWIGRLRRKLTSDEISQCHAE